MLRWSVIGLALAVNLPGLYQALVTQTAALDSVLIRLLITLPIVALLLGFLRTAGKPASRRPRR